MILEHFNKTVKTNCAPSDETMRVRQANVLASKSEMRTGEVIKAPWSVSCTVTVDASEV